MIEAIVFFFALDVLAAVEYLGISVTYLHSIRKTCADFASGLELAYTSEETAACGEGYSRYSS
jgi:hypothetical protein